MDLMASDALKPDAPGEVRRLRTTVAELEKAIRLMEEERDELSRRRRRNLLVIGVSISLLVHLALMLYLNTARRGGPGGPGAQPVSIEFAVIQEQELTLDELELEDIVPEVPMELDDLPDSEASLELAPEVAAASLDISPAGSVPTLAGSGAGDGSEGVLSGGGAGASFFGVSSRGTRFAYIVDISRSMADERKFEFAMRELARSIKALPDYASFFVVLFSSELMVPSMQKGWTRARRESVTRLIRWLDDQVDPAGGTQPSPAFQYVFALERRPDAIFFLTDGEIPPDTAGNVANLNSRGRGVVINTIAFGSRPSQDQLKEIARRSGGVYRYVPSPEW